MKELKQWKAVSRRVVINTDNRIEPRNSDVFRVTLYPSAVLGFRRSRSKREVIVPLASVYALAVRREVEAEKRENPKRRSVKVTRGLLSLERRG